jgi:hypothetical protein
MTDVDFSIGRRGFARVFGPQPAEVGWVFELQLWGLSRGISTFLGDLEPYEPCRVAGVIDRLFIDPRGGVIEASVSDGTGTVIAQWALRRPTPELALTPGRGVVLDGVAAVGTDGEFVIREATFETTPFLEVA